LTTWITLLGTYSKNEATLLNLIANIRWLIAVIVYYRRLTFLAIGTFEVLRNVARSLK
jgi:hypothetical protein